MSGLGELGGLGWAGRVVKFLRNVNGSEPSILNTQDCILGHVFCPGSGGGLASSDLLGCAELGRAGQSWAGPWRAELALR